MRKAFTIQPSTNRELSRLFDSSTTNKYAPVAILGGSIAQRNFVWRDLNSAGAAVRTGNLITLTATAHGLSVGEPVRLDSRNEAFRCSRQVPTIVDANTLTLIPDFDAPDQSSGTTIDTLVALQYLARYDGPGSWMRTALMNDNLAGWFETTELLAQGGDNWAQLLNKLDNILVMARRVAEQGGFIVGNLGADLVNGWVDDYPDPPSLRVARAITRDAGCRMFLVEVKSVDSGSGATTLQNRLAREGIRLLIENEMRVNPLLTYIDWFDGDVQRDTVDGFAPAGRHIDNVHWNISGSQPRGQQLAAEIVKKYNFPIRPMRSYRGDVITTNTPGSTLQGANVFQGFFSSSTTAATSTFVTGGSGAVSGNCDSTVRILRSGACGITTTLNTLTGADAGRQSVTFALTPSAGVAVEIGMVGINTTEMFRNMRASRRYEVGLRYALTSPVNIQSFEIFCDTGNATIRLGAGISYESPEYAGFPATSTVSVGESGRLWFPEPIVTPATLTQFRLVVRVVATAGSAGSCTVEIIDGVVRLVD